LKKGHNSGTLWSGLTQVGIMCSKFHLDDLKTMGGV